MYKIILFLNIFLSSLNLNVQHEIKESNRFNNFPLTKIIPSELLENILRYKEKSVTVKTKECETNKNTQFRLSDQEEEKWMPILNRVTKPIEPSNNKADNIKLDYSQLKKRTVTSDNQSLEQFNKTRELQTISNISVHELRNNEPIIELEDENNYETAKDNERQYTFSDSKEGKVNEENYLVPIDIKNGQYTQTHLDKKGYINEQLKLTQASEYTNRTRKSTTDTTKVKGSYIANNEDDDEDISFSAETNESDKDNDNRADGEKTDSIKGNKNNEVNEIGSRESTDESIDLNKIKNLLESRNGMKMTELSDSSILLMKSHRICYACGSASDLTCLKPNRKTAVKYCHSDNTACVAKSYTIGRSSYIIRDCGSSCMSSDINGLAMKYETCSICHSDLCNSADSINVFIAPLMILAIGLNKIIYQ